MLPTRYLLSQSINTLREEGIRPLLSRGATKLSRGGKDLIYSTPGVWQWSLSRSKERLDDCMQAESDVSDILDTAYGFRGVGLYRTIQPMLGRSEVRQLCESIPQDEVETVVEIGSARGGSLYIWSQYFTPEKMISIDINHLKKQQIWFDYFTPDDTIYVRGSSYDPVTVKNVQSVLGDRDVDFLFIDGDHRYEAVKKDFQYYSQMVRDGGWICFDDIHPTPYTGIEVHNLWEELQPDYQTKEFYERDEPEASAGLGLIHLTDTE